MLNYINDQWCRSWVYFSLPSHACLFQVLHILLNMFFFFLVELPCCHKKRYRGKLFSAAGRKTSVILTHSQLITQLNEQQGAAWRETQEEPTGFPQKHQRGRATVGHLAAIVGMSPFSQKQVVSETRSNQVHVRCYKTNFSGVEANFLLQVDLTDVRMRSLQMLLWYMPVQQERVYFAVVQNSE